MNTSLQPETNQQLNLTNHATRIVGLCGAAQSGKGTSASYFAALAYRMYNFIENFEIDEFGRIKIFDLKGHGFPEGKIFDPFTFNNDVEIDNVLRICSPHPLNITQRLAFGDTLKEVVHIMFGIDSELLWGNDKQKATETQYTAKQFIDLVGASKFPFKGKKPNDKLTVREILELWGTEVGRRIDPALWTSRLTERLYHIIEQWRPMLLLVDDLRFENEIETIRKIGGKVIGLTRKVKSSASNKHASEKIESLFQNCDYVVDNQHSSIQEQCSQLFPIFKEVLQ
jgi:energy-coupling factor transporter ATP-binding protein EcfA2